MARLGGVAFKSGPNKGTHKSAVCKGLNSGGKNKGKLKKGFKWTGGSACPVAAKTATASSSTKKKSTKKKAKSSGCAGIVKSGKNKGKLKKGFSWHGAPGKCPRKSKKK